MSEFSAEDLAELEAIRTRRERREALGLTAQEMDAAARFGMTPDAYAAAKQVRSAADWARRYGQQGDGQ